MNLRKPEVKFMGHVLSSGGLKPNPNKGLGQVRNSQTGLTQQKQVEKCYATTGRQLNHLSPSLQQRKTNLKLKVQYHKLLHHQQAQTVQLAQLHQQQDQAQGTLGNLYSSRITCARDTLSLQTNLTNIDTCFLDFRVHILCSELLNFFALTLFYAGSHSIQLASLDKCSS